MIPRQGEQCPVVIISYMGYSPPKCTCNDNQTHPRKYMILLECLHAQSHVSSPHRLPHTCLTLQEIHSLPTEVTDRLNSVGNYRRNIDGTKHIIFSTFLLPFTDRILTENYRRKCSVGNFPAICRRQLLGTIYRHNTYGKLLTEVFRR